MGVCQAVRTTDHLANHKSLPNDPTYSRVPSVWESYSLG